MDLFLMLVLVVAILIALHRLMAWAFEVDRKEKDKAKRFVGEVEEWLRGKK